MKADSLKISKVFSVGGDVLYILPHFQREYSWEEENWKTLLSDVLEIYEAYNQENEPEHFMGSLVVINDGTRNGTIPAFKLVDGQQRLISISLLLCALERLIRTSHPEIARKTLKLLTNPDESGEFFFKLLPTKKYGDRLTYTSIVNGEEESITTESSIRAAFNYLFKELEIRLSKGEIDPSRLFLAITNCLQVVFIDLDQRERPFEIFESLNAKAKPLSPADLVRNYIAMRLPEGKQEEIFDKYWAPLDDLLKEKRTVGKSRLGELTAFLRHYMAMLVGFLPNERHVYERFRDRMEKEFSSHSSFVNELSVLKSFGTYYDRLLRPSHESNKEISTRLERLNTLEVSTAYPFLLAMYDAREQGKLTTDVFLRGLEVLENYLVRRYLAGEPTNYLNKMFPTLWPLLDVSNFAESLRLALLTRNYPSDSKVKQELYSEVLYKGSQALEKTRLILETINQQLSAGSGGYTVLDGSPTIEHIMPQTLSESWKKYLGENWDQVYRDYLNTIGNLTLVTQGWNSALSNEVFERKKVLLASHALKLNSSYFSSFSKKWDESAIRLRSEFLADQILKIWPAFGDPPSKVTGKGTVPKILTMIGDSHRVNSWRDVQFITTETVIQYVKDFNAIIAQIPNYFFKEETRYTHRQLSNGLWLYTNLSGASVRNYCHRIIELAGIPEEEWAVEEE